MRKEEIYKANDEVIDDQVRKYFFNEGYINKKKSVDYYYKVFGMFFDENAKIMNNARTKISKEAYQLGRNHEFPNLKNENIDVSK